MLAIKLRQRIKMPNSKPAKSRKLFSEGYFLIIVIKRKATMSCPLTIDRTYRYFLIYSVIQNIRHASMESNSPKINKIGILIFLKLIVNKTPLSQ
jgi:hypothetical protein